MDQTLLDQLALEAAAVNSGPGSDEYFAARFAGGDKRYAVWVILTLKSTIENIPFTVSDPGVARLKLAWWQNQSGETNPHPLFRIAESLSINREHLELALDNLVCSIDRHYVTQRFDTESDRERWFSDCYQALYGLIGTDGNPASSSELCGAVEAARSLLRFKDELDSGFIRVSKEVFHRENINIDTMISDPDSNALRTLITTETIAADRKLDTAIRNYSTPSAATSNPALTYAWLTKRKLEETIADGAELLRRKVELTPLRKLWIAWRSR